MKINATHHQGAFLVLLSSLHGGHILYTQNQTNFLSDKGSMFYLVGRPRFAAADRTGWRSSFCGLDSWR